MTSVTRTRFRFSSLWIFALQQVEARFFSSQGSPPVKNFVGFHSALLDFIDSDAAVKDFVGFHSALLDFVDSDAAVKDFVGLDSASQGFVDSLTLHCIVTLIKFGKIQHK